MTRRYTALEATELAEFLARRIDATPVPGVALRVAVDGPDCADPVGLADGMIAALQALGRPAELIRADSFWRDASLRFEFGRDDIESLPSWLDADALNREVLGPLGPGGSGRFLPSLRDPGTNRSTRVRPRPARPREIVLIVGAMLLGRRLDFDHTVHLSVSPAARARRTPEADAWMLPALLNYDARVRPADIADVSIRLDDPTRPAVSD